MWKIGTLTNGAAQSTWTSSPLRLFKEGHDCFEITSGWEFTGTVEGGGQPARAPPAVGKLVQSTQQTPFYGALPSSLLEVSYSPLRPKISPSFRAGTRCRLLQEPGRDLTSSDLTRPAPRDRLLRGIIVTCGFSIPGVPLLGLHLAHPQLTPIN